MEQVIHAGIIFRPPETPRESMEFLSRSWSVSSLQVSKALTTMNRGDDCTTIEDDASREIEESVNGGESNFNDFSFAQTSSSSQLVMERILSHSPEASPRTSSRLSHSSGPINGGQSCGSLTDSPPASPSRIDDFKFCHINNPVNTQSRPESISSGGRTVGRWLKDRKEKRKEESRAHNAQLHAAVTIAGVSAAIASIAAARAAFSGAGKDEQRTKTDAALASAATLVAAQCFEAAEAMGAEREHLSAVVSSAVNVRSAGDIMTLTASAATALRGAATLKARTLKEVWNIAAVIPVDKGIGLGDGRRSNSSCSDELVPVDNFLDIRSRELLAKGCELLKRTRKGDLHWKIVSVYINQMSQVMLKMKSRHVGGTFTKKKKNVVLDVCKDMPSWPGRHLLEGGEHRRYFGLKTISRGLVEFECKNQKECDLWTQGVSRLLTIAADLKNRRRA